MENRNAPKDMKSAKVMLLLILATCVALAFLHVDWYWYIIGVVGAMLLAGALDGDKYKKEKEEKVDKDYSDAFFQSLKNNGIESNITVFRAPDFGLAISDDMQKVGIFSSQKELTVYNNEQIISCESMVSFTEIIKNNTTAPIVTWNTTGNTTGTINKKFAHMELIITVEDNKKPVWTIKFNSQEQGEKYHALLNSVIRKKQPTPIQTNNQSDKLIALFQMYKEGLLTQEEFNAQKKALA